MPVAIAKVSEAEHKEIKQVKQEATKKDNLKKGQSKLETQNATTRTADQLFTIVVCHPTHLSDLGRALFETGQTVLDLNYLSKLSDIAPTACDGSLLVSLRHKDKPTIFGAPWFVQRLDSEDATYGEEEEEEEDQEVEAEEPRIELKQKVKLEGAVKLRATQSEEEINKGIEMMRLEVTKDPHSAKSYDRLDVTYPFAAAWKARTTPINGVRPIVISENDILIIKMKAFRAQALIEIDDVRYDKLYAIFRHKNKGDIIAAARDGALGKFEVITNETILERQVPLVDNAFISYRMLDRSVPDCPLPSIQSMIEHIKNQMNGRELDKIGLTTRPEARYSVLERVNKSMIVIWSIRGTGAGGIAGVFENKVSAKLGITNYMPYNAAAEHEVFLYALVRESPM